MKPGKRTSFQTLCRCLTGALGRPLAPSDLPASPLEWEKVLRLSSDHLVTPQLRWALREQRLFSELPTDVAEYLEAIYTLNLEKNTRCEDQLAQFIQALNSIGVRPLLLKGAAAIVGGLYPTSGERIITDLDVLIPALKLPEILDKLASLGYQVLDAKGNWAKIGSAQISYNHHHYPPVYNPDWPATVELHVQPVVLRYGSLLMSDEMFRAATALNWCGGDCLLPAPNHQIIHNIVHAFLQDTRNQVRRMSLRQSLEFVLASATYRDRIDWDSIRQRFDSLGYGVPLRQYLALANACLCFPLPEEVTIDRNRKPWTKPYLFRLNLESPAGSLMLNLVIWMFVRLRNLYRNPARIRRLGDADFYRSFCHGMRRL